MKFYSVFQILFIMMLFFISGCAAITMNRPKSDFVLLDTADALSPSIKTKKQDVMFVMMSDIQCRDIKECKRLDKSFDSLNGFLKRYPDTKKIILVAGDITQNAFVWQTEDYFNKEHQLDLDEIHKICGNHDTKSGLSACLTLIHPHGLYYKTEIGNIVLIGLSNWHEKAPLKNDFQRYIPDDGLKFLLEEGSKALLEHKMLFILVHEKPHGIARLSDPRILLFWRNDTSSVYNSDELKQALKKLSYLADKKNGISLFYIYGHTHTPYEWWHTTVTWNDIIFINTSAMRRTDTVYDMEKISPSRFLLGLFGIKIDASRDPFSLAFGKIIKTIIPWNKHSTVRVMFLKCGSPYALLFARNLTKDEWYHYGYHVQLARPFMCE